MKYLCTFLLLSGSLAAATPDCYSTYLYTNRALTVDNVNTFSPNSMGKNYNNQVTACNAWSISYFSEGFDSVSLQILSAPSSSNTAVPSSYISFNGQLVSGNNPSTLTSGSVTLEGYNPWVTTQLATTGTGTLKVFIYGWISLTYISANSGGGGGGGGGTVTSVNGINPIAGNVTLPNSGPTQALPAMITPVDWTSFNSKQNTLPKATSTTNGYLSSSDWILFNSKGGSPAVGNFTEATSNIFTISGGTNAVLGSGISITAKPATISQNGYLTTTDWNTFNNKQTLMPAANGTTNGYLTSSDWTKFNNAPSLTTTSTQVFLGPIKSPNFITAGYGFSTGIQNLFMPTMSPGGTSLVDLITGAVASVAPGGNVNWNTDGSFHVNGAITDRWQAPTVTSYLTLEIAFVEQNSLANNTGFMVPGGYSGTPSSASVEPIITLNSSWWDGGSGILLPTYVSYHVCCVTNTAESSNVVPLGLHVVSLNLTPNGPISEYVDGREVQDYWGHYGFPQTALVNGFLEFGGANLGWGNCSTCGFWGSIYGVATYSTTQTAIQVMQNYTNWIRMLGRTGVDVNSPGVYTNQGRGAQDQAGKNVQLIDYGESESWGHGLSSPSTQNFIAQAAPLINGGSTYGFAYGYDVNNEYITHKAIKNIVAQYSPIAENVVVFFSSANDCKTSLAQNTYPTYTTNVAFSAARDAVIDAKYLQSLGWTVILAAGYSTSVTNASNQLVGDQGKSQCNKELRQLALSNGIPYWDIAAWPLIGADNAYTGGATGCSGGAIYLDQVHLTACTDAVLGGFLATLVNKLLFSAPTTTAAATYNMTGMESPLITNDPSGTVIPVITLPDCIGLTGQSLTIVNQGGDTDTLQGINTWGTETIGGASTKSILVNSSLTVTAYNKGDSTSGCSWSY